MFKLIKKEMYLLLTNKALYLVLAFILLIIGLNVFSMGRSNKEKVLSIDLYYLDNIMYSKEYKSNYENLINNTNNRLKELTDKYTDYNRRYLIKKYIRSLLYSYYFNQEFNIDNTTNENTLNEYLLHIDNNDTNYFINIEIKNLESEKSLITEDSSTNVEVIAKEIELLKYRIDNNIYYDMNNIKDYYFNLYESAQISLVTFKTNDTEKVMSEEKRKESIEEYTKNSALYEYAYLNNVDVNNIYNASYFMKDLPVFPSLHFVLIAYICAHSICKEYNRGTIKQLLTKPYRRWKVLLSMIIADALVVIISIGILYLGAVIMCGIHLGWDSFVPIYFYHNSLSKVVAYNIHYYCLLEYLYILPQYLFIFFFTIVISVSFNKESLSIIFAMIYILISKSFPADLLKKLPILKYFFTYNWDLTYLIDGSISEYNIATSTSIIVMLIYYLIMLYISFYIFNKRDIKNG